MLKEVSKYFFTSQHLAPINTALWIYFVHPPPKCSSVPCNAQVEVRLLQQFSGVKDGSCLKEVAFTSGQTRFTLHA